MSNMAELDPREMEYERVRGMIRELAGRGFTVHKISIYLHRTYNTVKHWTLTGRVESYDCRMLEELHREYCNVSHLSFSKEEKSGV